MVVSRHLRPVMWATSVRGLYYSPPRSGVADSAHIPDNLNVKHRSLLHGDLRVTIFCVRERSIKTILFVLFFFYEIEQQRKMNGYVAFLLEIQAVSDPANLSAKYVIYKSRST